jgi:hypothetical protein
MCGWAGGRQTMAGDLEAIRSLLGAGADPLVTNLAHEAPLHLAARRGDLAAVKLLSAARGAADLPGAGGRTALHLAVLAGAVGAVQYLCEVRGADTTLTDDSGRTALQLAHEAAGEGSVRPASAVLPGRAGATGESDGVAARGASAGRMRTGEAERIVRWLQGAAAPPPL